MYVCLFVCVCSPVEPGLHHDAWQTDQSDCIKALVCSDAEGRNAGRCTLVVACYVPLYSSDGREARGYCGGSPTTVQACRPCPLWEPSPTHSVLV